MHVCVCVTGRPGVCVCVCIRDRQAGGLAVYVCNRQAWDQAGVGRGSQVGGWALYEGQVGLGRAMCLGETGRPRAELCVCLDGAE